ncbi:AAA family ATPase [Gemmobacter sp. 24YEA27]|uniref:AAA family ATPase n=1 Tax=Gemmobacter sp. 24YEA27 TaxID=3040672 RepID=UPI0024B37F50|nr:AAA family ATPase [Gemmobacter sp. 24YEA27]
MLLGGPPGIGKSHWARKFGDLLTAPVMVLEVGSEAASFGLVGSQRGWSGAEPGRLIRTILRTAVANPIVVVDEIEKAGAPTTTKGHAFGLTEATLPLLEPLSARRWSCPYYQVEFDMRWIGWIFTANTAAILSEPFRSRCPPIRLRHLTCVELGDFVRREGARRELSETAIEIIAEVLAHPSLWGHRPSLRIAGRMLQRAADLEKGPLLR